MTEETTIYKTKEIYPFKYENMDHVFYRVKGWKDFTHWSIEEAKGWIDWNERANKKFAEIFWKNVAGVL